MVSIDKVVVDEINDSVKLKEAEIKSEVKTKKVKQLTPNIDKTKELYEEFNSFLEDKTDIVPDLGEKITITTGIDLMDAILGGGFAVGALNIIVGNPGSGKCLCYDEEIEVYVE